MELGSNALLTDLYQLNIVQAYLEHGKLDAAVFEFFVRRLPAQRGFLLAAGLEQCLEFLENLHFTGEEIAWLKQSGKFSAELLDYLAAFRFTGDVDAMPEGTVFFATEPILRITAPLPEAQLVETRLINILHFQSLIASKAARMALIAPGKPLVDFGLRRAHGAEAGIMAARASFIAGFAGTATVLAGKLFGIPVRGTMAHSFIEAFDDEMEAFESEDIRGMINAGAPVDGFGIGTSMTTSFDLPALDCAYKLQEYAGLPRRKRSAGVSERSLHPGQQCQLSPIRLSVMVKEGRK